MILLKQIISYLFYIDLVVKEIEKNTFIIIYNNRGLVTNCIL